MYPKNVLGMKIYRFIENVIMHSKLFFFNLNYSRSNCSQQHFPHNFTPDLPHWITDQLCVRLQFTRQNVCSCELLICHAAPFPVCLSVCVLCICLQVFRRLPTRTHTHARFQAKPQSVCWSCWVLHLRRRQVVGKQVEEREKGVSARTDVQQYIYSLYMRVRT